MSDNTTAQPDSPSEAASLRLQAENLRRSVEIPLRREEYSGLQKLAVLLLILVTLAGSIYVLLDGALRQRLLVKAGDSWAKYVGNGEQEGFFKIPPPPPRTVEPRVVYPAGSVTLGAAEPDGTIYKMEGDSEDASVEKTYVPPPKTPESGAAYNILRAKSQIAGKLAAGELQAWKFKEWKPVQSKPPLYYVDVVAERVSDSTEVHFVWSVDVQSQKVAPLSQAARDLEAGR